MSDPSAAHIKREAGQDGKKWMPGGGVKSSQPSPSGLSGPRGAVPDSVRVSTPTNSPTASQGGPVPGRNRPEPPVFAKPEPAKPTTVPSPRPFMAAARGNELQRAPPPATTEPKPPKPPEPKQVEAGDFDGPSLFSGFASSPFRPPPPAIPSSTTAPLPTHRQHQSPFQQQSPPTLTSPSPPSSPPRWRSPGSQQDRSERQPGVPMALPPIAAKVYEFEKKAPRLPHNPVQELRM
eukprot:6504652-Prymnesium_polylepis.1